MKSRQAAAVSAAAAVAAGVCLWACGGDPAAPPSDTGATALATANGFFHPAKDRIPHELATNPGTPWGDYVGSQACKECHEKDYAAWRESFHSRTLYDAVPKTMFGDFEKARVFKDPKMPYFAEARREGSRFFLRVWENPDFKGNRDIYGSGLPEKAVGDFELIYAFGNRRHQPYVAKLPDGYWVLPVYWNDVDKEWQFDGWRHYVTNCASCHVTGIKTSEVPVKFRKVWDKKERRMVSVPVGFSVTKPLKYVPAPSDEGWADGAVGCEVCHGPGKPHIAKVNEMGAASYRAYLADGGTPTIYNPKNDSPETRMRQCDSCHNFFSESSVTWVPLPRGYDHERVDEPIEATPGNIDAKQFYADSTHMSPCTVGAVFRKSRMGKKGVECRDCHDAHGNQTFGSLTRPLAGNALCISCHKEYAPREALAAHSRHDPDKPGSSCVECHMQRDKRFTNGVQVMSEHLHSHDIAIPTGDQRPGGPLPSCNVCHVDRTPAWSREKLGEWLRAKPPPK